MRQLDDRYKDARLIEVSEGSYLIKNVIKLAVLGTTVKPTRRSEDSITKKSYLKGLSSYPDQRKYILEKSAMGAASKAAGMSSASKIQIGDSVGRLLT